MRQENRALSRDDSEPNCRGDWGTMTLTTTPAPTTVMMATTAPLAKSMQEQHQASTDPTARTLPLPDIDLGLGAVEPSPVPVVETTTLNHSLVGAVVQDYESTPESTLPSLNITEDSWIGDTLDSYEDDMNKTEAITVSEGGSTYVKNATNFMNSTLTFDKQQNDSRHDIEEVAHMDSVISLKDVPDNNTTTLAPEPLALSAMNSTATTSLSASELLTKSDLSQSDDGDELEDDEEEDDSEGEREGEDVDFDHELIGKNITELLKVFRLG